MVVIGNDGATILEPAEAGDNSLRSESVAASPLNDLFGLSIVAVGREGRKV